MRIIFHGRTPASRYTTDETLKNADNIPWEDTGLKNKRYTLSMARSGNANSESDSDTGSSQFFINHADNADLDNYNYPYVVFGKVIEGFSVVDAIASVPTDSNDWPDDPPVIISVVIEE
jgi:cyclophilin family peptidyl-prolyl cis-trans isomerase